MDTAVKLPLSERINLRLIVFFAVIGLMIGYPVYWFVHEQITGGISDAGGGYKEIELKAMSTFAFDQVNGSIDDVPKRWRELDGKKVILYGELWQPYTAGDKVAGFDLCYSIAKCCFSGPPQVQHFVKARVRPDAVAFHYPNQVKVVGTLHV